MVGTQKLTSARRPSGKTPGDRPRQQSRHHIQTKLRVGAADDRFEREADAIASAVMQRLASPQQSPNRTDRPDDADRPDREVGHGNSRVQRASADPTAAAPGHGADGGEASPEVASRIRRSSGGGRPLDAGVRSRMERGFGADFSGVRVHTGADADQLNRALSARAFTTGSDIYFATGQYRPESSSGQELLAHELTHTLQQSGTRIRRSTAPAAEVSRDRSAAVRRWDLRTGVDVDRAVSIRTIPTGQAVFMLKDSSGDEIVVKGEKLPISLFKLASLVHKSVHDVSIVDSYELSNAQKQRMLAKIGDPTVTNDQSWTDLGKTTAWSKWNKSNLAPDEHARSMHQEQIQPMTLHAQELAEGEDAKGQIAAGKFRRFLEFPKYVQELGAAAAADMFLGNADRIGGVVNLGNWMAAADQRVRLIDNMDDNAKDSFKNSPQNSQLFPPDMKAWAQNPKQYPETLVDRLLNEAEHQGDQGIVAWAQQGKRRQFIIQDFSRGFEETKAKIIRLYATDKKKKAGRRTKIAIKGESNARHIDYWEVVKARARFLKNPKREKSLTSTVMKRQARADKKRAKNG